VSRRKQGSNRRRKAVVLRARAHQHSARQRQDFHPKRALERVRQDDVLSHEDLQTANLVKHHPLAKSISDAGWGKFLGTLTFKAVGAGKRVQAGNPAFTSQRCSGCGVLVQQGLSLRWQSCPDCGTRLQRDHNAARNILRLGQDQKKGPAMARRGGVAVAASQNRESAGL